MGYNTCTKWRDGLSEYKPVEELPFKNVRRDPIVLALEKRIRLWKKKNRKQ